MREQRFKRWVCSVIVLTIIVVCGSPAVASESTEDDGGFGKIQLRIASVLLPGAGQAHDGHFTKAAMFASATVFSGAGLFFTQIHYSRALERYENEKRTYLAYPTLLEGTEVSYSDIVTTRTAMQAAFDQADERATWRNVFLGALVVTYGLNLLDVILSDADTGELSQTPPISLESSGGDIRLVKTFSF